MPDKVLKEKLGPIMTAGAFLLFGLVLTAVFYFLMSRGYARNLETTVGQSLSSLAGMEADAVGRWSRREIELARSLVDSILGGEEAGRLLAGTPGEKERTRLAAMLSSLKNAAAFKQAYIITPAAVLNIFSPGPGPALDRDSMAHAYRCMASLDDVFDGHLTTDGGAACFSLFVHLRKAGEGAHPACLLVRFNARDLVSILVGNSGPSSRTRSMLIHERSGSFAVLLRESGMDQDMQRSFPFASFSPVGPTARDTEPADGGLFVRRNDKGGKVLAAIHTVPDTAWHILVEQDLGIAAGTGLVMPSVFLPPALGFLLLAGSFIFLAHRREQAEAGRRIRSAVASAKEVLEASLQTVLDTSPNPVFRRDGHDVITHANAAFEQLVGRPMSEIVGANYRDLFPNAPQGKTPSAGRDGQPPVRVYETSFTTPEEEAHDLIVAESFITSAEGAFDESIGQIIDITQRKKAEQELRQLKEFTDEAVRHMTEGMIVTERDGRISFANMAAAEMLGYGPGELNGKLESEIIAPDQIDIVTRMAERREKGLTDRYEIDMLRKDGERRTILVSGGPKSGGDLHRGALAILTDITDRKRMEEEIRSLSLTDDLTGLANRRGFIALAGQQLKIAVRMNRRAILFFLDLDDLKVINDSFGHRRGDQALMDIGSLLKRNFRESDLLARYGGDEFAVLALEETGTEPARIIERLQSKLDAYNARAELEKSFKLYFSIGHVTFDPDFPASLEDLVARADLLMYEDKKRKKTG